ncbi:hypothetical protein HBI52_191010 [Parastagonospora nodorum]|nr:hypothetical protein HBI52_191010 [Parastagonospora nodorum]
MCAKDDLIERKGLLLTSTQTPNHVNTFSLDFAFSFANILSLIAFIISYRLFADKLNIQQSLLDRATVMLIIISVDKTQLLLISGDVARSTPSTLLAEFIPTTKIRDPLLKTLENAAKSRILLTCADRRIRQCYLTICAILKHYNFNIHVSLATDTLHLLLKGLVMKMLDFITSLKRFNNKRAFTELIAVVSLLFVLKAPFALHFIHTVCNLVTLAQYKSYDEDTLAYIQEALERINHALTYIIQDIRIYKALDSICTRANSEAYYITIVKQFYSITNKKDKRHNDLKHCDKKLYLILTIINYTCYNKDRKHIAYIKAFFKVLLFNNNRQINNTTRMLSDEYNRLYLLIFNINLLRTLQEYQRKRIRNN